MKTKLLIISLLIGSSLIFSQEQQAPKENEFSLTFQLRPRAEYRNGVLYPRNENDKAAAFINNRTRLSLDYARKELRFEHDPANPDDHGLPTGGIKSYFGFLSSDIGLVAGSEPVPGLVYAFRSVDGGTSWKQSECQGLPLDPNQETSVDKIIRINPTTAILPVRSYLADGNSVTYFCSTTDAAETWQYVGMLQNVEFFDFGTQLTGVAYGQGKTFQTQDGGITWTETTSGLPPAVTPVSVDMINDLAGFLVATTTPDTLLDNRLYMTGNNGKDWQTMPTNILESTTTNSTP